MHELGLLLSRFVMEERCITLAYHTHSRYYDLCHLHSRTAEQLHNGQGTLNGFLANMARQARTAEDFRDMAGAHWAPKVAGLVCAAHFLAHRLRLPPPSLLVVEAAAGAATRSKMQRLMLCFGLSARGARNQGLLGLGCRAGSRCGSQIAMKPLAAGSVA